jgi:hypothetical protein
MEQKGEYLGMYLFTDRSLAEEWILNKQKEKLSDIDFKIYQLQVDKEKINQQYSSIIFEEKNQT